MSRTWSVEPLAPQRPSSVLTPARITPYWMNPPEAQRMRDKPRAVTVTSTAGTDLWEMEE